jgi:hypothetical protein
MIELGVGKFCSSLDVITYVAFLEGQSWDIFFHYLIAFLEGQSWDIFFYYLKKIEHRGSVGVHGWIGVEI